MAQGGLPHGRSSNSDRYAVVRGAVDALGAHKSAVRSRASVDRRSLSTWMARASLKLQPRTEEETKQRGRTFIPLQAASVFGAGVIVPAGLYVAFAGDFRDIRK